MKKILLIDDDEIMLNLLGRLLKKEGFDVLTTADGPRGIELFQKEHPDVTLLDLGLPSMSGLDVLKRIRHMNPEAVIVIFSGYASPEAKEEALLNGAVTFFDKADDLNQLLDLVRNISDESS